MKASHVFKGFLKVLELTGLGIIAIATIIAVGQEVYAMYEHGKVALSDLLLLFIYLEVITMIGIYYQKNMLPVRFPIYIAIVALARYIILGSKELNPWDMLGIGITLLVLTISVFLVRLGHVKFPYEEDK
ncbi:MAG TPA: phosphate-starvation-inducible E [Oceanospirillales bacterium]|nr:phosphate-starvation-inducible E [Oceanospirillales bacterium]